MEKSHKKTDCPWLQGAFMQWRRGALNPEEEFIWNAEGWWKGCSGRPQTNQWNTHQEEQCILTEKHTQTRTELAVLRARICFVSSPSWFCLFVCWFSGVRTFSWGSITFTIIYNGFMYIEWMYNNPLLWVHSGCCNFYVIWTILQNISFMLTLCFALWWFFLGNMERQTKYPARLLERQINLVGRKEGKWGFHRISGIWTFSGL